MEDMLELLALLEPDDMTATGTFTEAIGALNFYLKNTSRTHWKQCARCLQVAGNTVSKVHIPPLCQKFPCQISFSNGSKVF